MEKFNENAVLGMMLTLFTMWFIYNGYVIAQCFSFNIWMLISGIIIYSIIIYYVLHSVQRMKKMQ